MSQPGGGKPERVQPQGGKPAGTRTDGGRSRRRRGRRPRDAPRPQAAPAAPRWAAEPGAKICRKCGGRMHPADWIWQKYGLCLGWRCANCKDKVMARSLPFKGLRKRTLDPDEMPPAAPPDAAADRAPRTERPVPTRTGNRPDVGMARPARAVRRPSADRRSRPS